jgi:hypothetical protein
MVTKPIKVERHGWYVTIEIQEVSKRPNWEIRVRIIRSKEGKTERRGHRFHVSPELAEKLQIDRWSDAKRKEVFAGGAKKVILRELVEIFAEPEGGLDSLRPLNEMDLTQ